MSAPIARPCPACGGSEWTPRRTWTSLRSCPGCGVFLNDRSPSCRDEEARYRDRPRPAEGGSEARAAAHWRLARRLAARGPGGVPSVLDVGCGAGAFLAAARRDGARVAGVEIDPGAAALARARGLAIVHGSILDVTPPAGPWDLVTFWDVLDQLDDPLRALGSVVPLLAPGASVVARGRRGTLHARVKMVTLGARRLVPWFPDPAVVHRWGFGRPAWKAVLERAGLVDVRVLPVGPGPGWASGSVLASGRTPSTDGACGLPLDRTGRLLG